jgi:hypothetical protein
MSPELSEALRKEIRTALDAEGGVFDVNVARRVYDLAIAARDMCIAASSTVKEAIDQIKDTNGPMETLDAADTPVSQVQASESFGARLLRELMATLPMLQGPRGELMATLPMLQGPRGEDPKQLVHALAEARRNGMHDVAEQIEVKLFGRALSGPRPIAAEEIDAAEGSYEQGFVDGRTGALPVSQEGAYHDGFLKGTEAKYLSPAMPPVRSEHAPDCLALVFDEGRECTCHSAAIAKDVRLGLSSRLIRDEIIQKVGMMASARTPEMQARYDAALARESVCEHPPEARYETPYDDGYQVFCRLCDKQVRLGRLRHSEGRRLPGTACVSEPALDGGQP